MPLPQRKKPKLKYDGLIGTQFFHKSDPKLIYTIHHSGSAVHSLCIKWKSPVTGVKEEMNWSVEKAIENFQNKEWIKIDNWKIPSNKEGFYGIQFRLGEEFKALREETVNKIYTIDATPEHAGFSQNELLVRWKEGFNGGLDVDRNTTYRLENIIKNFKENKWVKV